MARAYLDFAQPTTSADRSTPTTNFAPAISAGSVAPPPNPISSTWSSGLSESCFTANAFIRALWRFMGKPIQPPQIPAGWRRRRGEIPGGLYRFPEDEGGVGLGKEREEYTKKARAGGL